MFDFQKEHARVTAAYRLSKGLPMRPTYNLKGFVEVTMNIAGAEWEGEAEVIYHQVPAFHGAPDEPPHGEYIEIQSCKLIHKDIKVDITALLSEKMEDAIQAQILGE